MSRPAPLRALGTPRARAAGAATIVLALLLAVLTGPAALAFWSAAGTGSANASTGTLSAPVQLTAATTGLDEVAIDWTAGPGGVAPEGYYVTRRTDGATSAACSSSPTALLTAPSCTDTAVPDGDFTYVVTAVFRSWTAPSVASGSVSVVNAAALAFTTQPSDAPADATSTPPVSPGPTPATNAAYPVSAAALLGAAGAYSVLAGTSVTSTGATTVGGDLGVSPGTAVTGFGPTDPGTVGGDIHAGDTSAAQAQADLAAAYDELDALPADTEIVGDLGGRTLGPGTYHSTAALALTGTLLLDAGGDPDATFVLRTDAAFDTAADSRVTLINGARAANVFWVVTGAAGTGTSSFLSGTILSQGAITLGADSELVGRALSRGAVTLATSTVHFDTALPPTTTAPSAPEPAAPDPTDPDPDGTSTP